MRFRTRTVTHDGHTWYLRELSAGALRAMRADADELTQAMQLLALSLCDADYEPRYTPDRLEQGLAYLDGLPVRVVRTLEAAATELNEGTLDDARGN